MKEKKTEEELFEKALDGGELKDVSGGKCIWVGSSGSGKCSEVYYSESCTASVEKGSRCRSDDWCSSNESRYTYQPYNDEPIHSGT